MNRQQEGSLQLAVWLLSAVFCSFGVWLFLSQLSLVGSTWDEYVDFAIASDVAHNLNFVGNRIDSSQGRLTHLVGAASLRLLGDSVVSFKLPYVCLGLLGGLLLFAFVKSRVGSTTAVLITAYYLTNPFVLASSRTAATAGDILVLVTTFGFLWSGIRWLESSTTPRLIVFAGITGLCIATKLTNVALVPLGILVVIAHRVYATKASIPVIARELAVFACTTGALALVGHPPFWSGPTYMLGVIAAASNFRRPPYYLLGEFHPATPLEYFPAILISKLGIPFTILLAAATLFGAYRLKERPLDTMTAAGLVGIVMTSLFVLKDFQNANYYVPLVIPALILTAKLLQVFCGSRNGLVRAAAVCGFLGVIGHQAYRSASLSPDYLQAGREFGDRFQGEFAGPAVNHCQGSPMVIDALNQMPGTRELSPVYVIEHCLPIVNHDNVLGSIHARGFRFEQFDVASPPQGGHVVIVHNVIHTYRPNVAYHERAMKILADATRGCEKWTADPHKNDPYEIYRCSESIF